MNPDEEKAACEAPEEVRTVQKGACAQNCLVKLVATLVPPVAACQTHAEYQLVAHTSPVRSNQLYCAPESPCNAYSQSTAWLCSMHMPLLD